MFYTKNNKARKYFVGRRYPKQASGVNIFYSTPVKTTDKKGSLLSIVKHCNGEKTKIDLNGSDVNQLLRIINKGKQLISK